MARQADTTVVLPMDRMLNVLGPGASLRQAYERLDEAIGEVARAIINMIVAPGLVNVTFSDVNTVLKGGGPGLSPNRLLRLLILLLDLGPGISQGDGAIENECFRGGVYGIDTKIALSLKLVSTARLCAF